MTDKTAEQKAEEAKKQADKISAEKAAQADRTTQTANNTGIDPASPQNRANDPKKGEDKKVAARTDQNYNSAADEAVALSRAAGMDPEVVRDDDGNKIYDPRFDSGTAEEARNSDGVSEQTNAELDAGRKALEKHKPVQRFAIDPAKRV